MHITDRFADNSNPIPNWDQMAREQDLKREFDTNKLEVYAPLYGEEQNYRSKRVLNRPII